MEGNKEGALLLYNIVWVTKDNFEGVNKSIFPFSPILWIDLDFK